MKIKIRVVPRSSRDEVAGPMADGAIKVKLTAPPVEGQANEALIKLLAEHLGVKKNKIKIISGLTSKNKVVEVEKYMPLPACRKYNFRRIFAP